MLLENAKLANSTDQDENEANRAHATDLLVSRLVVGLFLELLPERLLSVARSRVVETFLITLLDRLSSVMLTMLSVFAMASVVLLLGGYLWLRLGLDLRLLNLSGLLLVLLSLLELLLEVLEELG